GVGHARPLQCHADIGNHAARVLVFAAEGVKVRRIAAGAAAQYVDVPLIDTRVDQLTPVGRGQVDAPRFFQAEKPAHLSANFIATLADSRTDGRNNISRRGPEPVTHSRDGFEDYPARGS